MPSFSAAVPDTQGSPVRLDKFIAEAFQDMNRSKLKSGVTEIFLNGKKSKLSAKVKAGDKIEIVWEDSVPSDIEAENIPLDIIYEDENVTVVNKAQGMVTHPAAGNWNKTLVNALLYHWGREKIHNLEAGTPGQILAARRPGIVHRLDKDTSGIIITAKNRMAEEFLQKQFQNHKSIIKEYICICCGHPKTLSGKIETQIIRDVKNRKRFTASLNKEEGKYACTIYKCFATYGPFSLMRVRIKTGRTHQIRVHMKYLGCPILGDPVYGNALKGSPFEKATLMLHSYFLKIKIPGKAERMIFKAEVPLRFKKVLRTLHEKYGKN